MAPSGKGSSRVGGVGEGPGRAGGVGPADAAPEIERTESVKGVGEIDEVDPVRAATVAEVEAVNRVGGPAVTDPVAQVAAALRAGRISVDEAVDRLIDDAVTRRVGRAIEPGGELEARLRRVLKDYAGADPLISEKIRRLEARRGTGRGDR